MEFKDFAQIVKDKFSQLSKEELFRVDVPGDDLWDLYLSSFPEGSNPIFRVRTEHDGSYDRSFIRRLGNVVALTDKGIVSIWSLKGLSYPYSEVCEKLRERVESAKINSLFRTNEKKLGYVSTKEVLEDGTFLTWNHFNAEISNRHYTPVPDEVIGDTSTTAQMFKRALVELKPEAFETVLDLIDSNSVYRGQEFRKGVAEFQAIQAKYLPLSEENRNLFIWLNLDCPVARLRNSAIGTLLIDLSEGKDVEASVISFGKKVDPLNYKRPTSIITQGMVDQAMKKIQELDIEDSLERRHAKISDVSVNNVLWVSNKAQAKMKGGLAGLLEGEITKKLTTKHTDISISNFMDMLPEVTSLEVLVRNSLKKNLVSITAPVHENITPIFKWNNNFAWSYNGNVTDAIKERVKAAGGNVEADIRVSLAWFNHDDLDIHAETPYGHIYFGNKAGILDVDMNAGSGKTREAVENLAFNNPKDGDYEIYVNQFCRRETTDVGFTLEIEFNDHLEQYSYNKAVVGQFGVLKFKVENGKVINLEVVNSDTTQNGMSQVIWGVQTEKFQPISTLMFSPNYWDNKEIGNKHWFFILEDCLNDEPVRGIYNEYLRSDLDEHRKVFEVLGNKTKCPISGEQLSGLGFSSTKGESVIVKVTGPKINAIYKVNF